MLIAEHSEAIWNSESESKFVIISEKLRGKPKMCYGVKLGPAGFLFMKEKTEFKNLMLQSF